MKAVKAILFGLIALATAKASAAHDGLYRAGDRVSVYITALDGCSSLRDSRAPNQNYMGVYINNRPKRYDWYEDQRVYIWVNDCEGFENKTDDPRLVGKRVVLSLKESGYSPGNWDLDIANFSSISGLIYAAQTGSQTSIEFVDSQTLGGPDLTTVKITGSSDRFDATFGTINSQSMIVVDKRSLYAEYYNSNHEVAIHQSISDLEMTLFSQAIRKASVTCPVEMTMSRSARRIVKVRSTCVDLSQGTVLKNQG